MCVTIFEASEIESIALPPTIYIYPGSCLDRCNIHSTSCHCLSSTKSIKSTDKQPDLARSLQYRFPKIEQLSLHLPHITSTRQTTMHLAPLFLSLAAVSVAAPWSLFDDAHDFSDELSEFYGKVSKYINEVRHNITPNGQCDPSKISLPSYASGLPSPGAKPMYVALGRGTQVYTHLPGNKLRTANTFNRTIHAQTPHPTPYHNQLARLPISTMPPASLQTTRNSWGCSPALHTESPFPAIRMRLSLWPISN